MTATPTTAPEEWLLADLRKFDHRDLCALLVSLWRFHPQFETMLADPPASLDGSILMDIAVALPRVLDELTEDDWDSLWDTALNVEYPGAHADHTQHDHETKGTPPCPA